MILSNKIKAGISDSSDKILRKIFYYLTIIILVLLPVYHWYLPPFMILYGIIFLIGSFNRTSEFQKLTVKNKFLFYCFILFFVWQVIGMVYSEHDQEGIRNITLRLPLFLLPLILVIPDVTIKQKTNTLLKIFAVSTFLYVIACMVYASFRSLEINNGNWIINPHPDEYPWLNFFYGPDFAIFQHPSYLSMYILLSVFIACEALFEKRNSKLIKWFWILVSLVLIVSVYLLSSRAAIIASVITIPCYFIIKLVTGKIKKIWWIGVCLGATILFITLLSNPRLQLLINKSSDQELINKALKESRISIWNASFNLIKENFLLGVGTGDIQYELNEEYKRMGKRDLYKDNELNAHNQFIETSAENGLIGLLLLLSVFGLMFGIAVTNGNILYLMFILIIFISFLFETMLNRLAGLAFFSVFSFLLLYVDNKNIDSQSFVKD